jgi:hypothetical protein
LTKQEIANYTQDYFFIHPSKISNYLELIQ